MEIDENKVEQTKNKISKNIIQRISKSYFEEQQYGWEQRRKAFDDSNNLSECGKVRKNKR